MINFITTTTSINFKRLKSISCVPFNHVNIRRRKKPGHNNFNCGNKTNRVYKSVRPYILGRLITNMQFPIIIVINNSEKIGRFTKKQKKGKKERYHHTRSI